MSMAERPHGHQPGVDLVESYLAAMGRGDLAVAGRCLAAGARLVFPGGRTFHDLNSLTEASRSRYRSIDKHRDRYDSMTHEDGSVTVISQGRLFGENVHGVSFDGVRYIDVFLLRHDLIEEQLVFNDLSETGVLQARAVADLPPAFHPIAAAP